MESTLINNNDDDLLYKAVRSTFTIQIKNNLHRIRFEYE